MGAVYVLLCLASSHARAEDAVLPPPPPARDPPPAPASALAPEAASSLATPAAPAPAALAPAAEQSIHPRSPEETPSRWYGWQTLAADGAALALTVGSISLAGGSSDSAATAMGWGALGTYTLGGPVIHLAHANPGRGFASLGLRVGGPILLALLGIAAEDCGEHGGDFCGFRGALIGGTTGVIAAVAIDAAVFAYDDQPESDTAGAPRFRLGFGPRGVVASGSF